MMPVKKHAKHETKKMLVRKIAEMLSGLQVPLSLDSQVGPGKVLGTARDPLIAVRDALGLFGYPNADEIEAKLWGAMMCGERAATPKRARPRKAVA
jgi:hypothetical protein